MDDKNRIAREASEAARMAFPGEDLSVFWDGVWIRRVGSHYLPDAEWGMSDDPQWAKWIGRVPKFLRDANDYWFHVYRPMTGDVIVDIGAGRGEDVFAFSQAVGSTGRVYAVEPHPTSLLSLRKLCQYNRLTNVTVLPFACTETSGTMQIETLPVWESNYLRAGEPSPSSHTVSVQPFDEVAEREGIGEIDFLKMNIEGAELEALPGCRESLDRTKSVCIAAHDFRANRGEGERFRTLAYVKGFLVECGFELTGREEDPRYYVPFHVHGRRKI